MPASPLISATRPCPSPAWPSRSFSVRKNGSRSSNSTAIGHPSSANASVLVRVISLRARMRTYIEMYALRLQHRGARSEDMTLSRPTCVVLPHFAEWCDMEASSAMISRKERGPEVHGQADGERQAERSREAEQQ